MALMIDARPTVTCVCPKNSRLNGSTLFNNPMTKNGRQAPHPRGR
jgi:hypothetical protein